MSDQIIARLDRIETKVDTLTKDVAEMRGERKGERRVMWGAVSIVSAVISTVLHLLFPHTGTH